MSGLLDAGRLGQKMAELEKHMRAVLAPEGVIPGIPPLLDRRRLTTCIHDDAFKLQASFDVCFVHQIRWGEDEKETFGDTMIIKPETSKKKEMEEAPRGVLVSAGLSALDSLRSNGIDLGHIISFVRQAPWRMPVATVLGHEFHLVILRAGDITGSEDLRKALVSGECRTEWDDEVGQHFYVGKDGKRWTPRLPFLPADY